MDPDVCRFVSNAFYDGRLHSAPSCAGQLVGPGGWIAGTGLRWIPVEHVGNKSPPRKRPPKSRPACSPFSGARGLTSTAKTGRSA
jgi:hypothetical protein